MRISGMDTRRSLKGALLATLVGASMLGAAGSAAAAAAAAEPKLAAGVTHVANLEVPPAQYIVANPTSVYSNHFIYGTTVTGQLARGQQVEALGKVPGYEWILVGRNGTGIGYVPISMLSPANLYIP
jgi:hypothetical protein